MSEEEIKDQYKAIGLVAYEQAKQSGLPEYFCNEMAQQAMVDHAKAEIDRILQNKTMTGEQFKDIMKSFFNE